MEVSTQQCTFCKNWHSCTSKRVHSISKRNSASAATLGDVKIKQKFPKSLKNEGDLNVLLEDLKDIDMDYVESSTKYIQQEAVDDTLPSDEEIFESLEKSKKMDESEFSTTVTFTKLEKDIPLNKIKGVLDNKGNKTSVILAKMEYKFNRTNWYACLMDAYSKTGNGHLALKLLKLARGYNIVKPSSKAQMTYNILIDYAVRESDHKTAVELYKWMLQDCVKPDTQTFISLIRMAKELNESKRKGFLYNLETQMAKVNVQFNDLFERGTFRYDDRDVVLANIRLIRPEFSPIYKVTFDDTNKDVTSLKYFPHTRTSYKEYLEDKMDFRQMQVALKEQIRLEWEGFVQIENISLSPEDIIYREMEAKQHAELEAKWRSQLKASFERRVMELEQLEKRNDSVETLYPYLLLMDKDIYVDCMIKEVMMLCKIHHSFAKSVGAVALDLGNLIYKKYEVQSLMEMGVLDKIVDIHYRYLQWYSGIRDLGKTNSRNAWKRIQYEADKSGASSTASVPKWPSQLVSAIGKFLVNIIVEDVMLPLTQGARSLPATEVPLFMIMYRRSDCLMLREIQCHSQVAQIFKARGSTKLTFQTHELPSRCPPRPWCAPLEGGYYISQRCVLRRSRTMNCLQTNLLEAQPPGGMDSLYDSLNVLGATPWRVNNRILNLVKHIFINGGSEELDVPPPSSVVEDLPTLKFSDTVEERQYQKKQYRQKMKRQAMHSMWCDALHRISIADTYKDKLFWLPHSIDFRGRAYPVPPHLSHLCADLGRALLMFGFGKPLGPNGLDWMKIHAINLSGRLKQHSTEEKLQYANEHIDDIVDSAERPLDGKRWWAETDTRWQVLAACIEISEALKLPNPDEYVSYLPIHQDGSCNGLQHYAALGRDPFGAYSVNLRKSDKPQDVYTVVVEQVEKIRKKDAERGIEAAKHLDGLITRKMIKQTIMTTVYGVTMYGARQQIERQLKALDKLPVGINYMCSKYLAAKTFDALNSMFVSAKEIQEWLTNCARLIIRDCRRPVEWITPMGLHVLQPYIKSEYTGRGVEQMKTILDAVKQRNAFAPNFIHSLDSTHMMLTSLNCDADNISFASVHDCFWTHASTVVEMNQICRKQFVKLHGEPIIENMHRFFMEYYNNQKSPCIEYSRQFETKTTVEFPPPPKRGKFNIDEVLESPYFFS